MLATVVLLLLCALTAVAGVPLILKLVPPNPVYGVHTERAMAREKTWYEVNWFAGWALVAAAGLTVLTVMHYGNTLLRPFGFQFLAYAVFVSLAVGASFWYEREVSVNGRRWSRRRKARSSRHPAGEVEPRRHAQR